MKYYCATCEKEPDEVFVITDPEEYVNNSVRLCSECMDMLEVKDDEE